MSKTFVFLQRVSEDQVFEETDINGRNQEEESETHQMESDEQEEEELEEEVKEAAGGILTEAFNLNPENEERKSPRDDGERTSLPEIRFEESTTPLGSEDEKPQNEEEEDEERKPSEADYEERMSNCVGDEKNSLHDDDDNERRSPFEEPQISLDLNNVPIIGANWDNSFLQDEEDCLDQSTAAADDQKPLLDDNLVGCLVVRCSSGKRVLPLIEAFDYLCLLEKIRCQTAASGYMNISLKIND